MTLETMQGSEKADRDVQTDTGSGNPKIGVLRSQAMRLPLSPGVYLMRNKKNEIIYIGKAKALKNRVSQYFGSNRNHDLKVRKMVQNVDHFEYIVTDSEFEALVLESSLIKQNQPKYNILLKDDKGYSYIRISPGEWPRLSEVKQKEKDGGSYLGPYVSSWAVKESVESACRIFHLPTCSRRFPQDFGKGRPCLNFHIKQCDAPCTGKMLHSTYMESFQEALEFIKEGMDASTAGLQKRMERAAEELDFERAAKLRDRLRMIDKLKDNQKVVASKHEEQDIITMVQGERQHTAFEVFRFTGHKLSDRESFVTEGCAENGESREEFVRQYYSIRDRVPPLILLDGPMENEELTVRWLEEKRGRKVKFVIPQRGESYHLVQMCKKNAAETLATRIGQSGKEISALDELKQLLGLPGIPSYIESYDISNLSGGENVAGMVVFENGRPLKSAYRKFKIKGFVGQDDYGSMREVMQRRFTEYKNNPNGVGFGRMPDLILLDGGKGHVATVKPVLDAMGIDVPVFGMVKDDKHKTRAIAATGGEIAIQSIRSAFTLLSGIQEEVHRFAIGYHRQQRRKHAISSTLLSIEGVGPARAKALLKHYRTVKAISEASLQELEGTPGMNKPAAEKLYRHFHSEN